MRLFSKLLTVTVIFVLEIILNWNTEKNNYILSMCINQIVYLIGIHLTERINI